LSPEKPPVPITPGTPPKPTPPKTPKPRKVNALIGISYQIAAVATLGITIMFF
jgi:hypothetical protein